MKILFLDYDGVVNTPMWNKEGTKCSYGIDIVNNFQAVQWVSELCQKHDLKIVVTSTWRFQNSYKDALIKGGLRENIEIIDRTPHISGAKRGEEINAWLNTHKDVESYIILDDDTDFTKDQMKRLVRCNPYEGFTMKLFNIAERIVNNI